MNLSIILLLLAVACFAAQNPVIKGVEEEDVDKEEECFIKVSPKARTTADRSRHRPLRKDSIEEHNRKHTIPGKMKRKEAAKEIKLDE